MQAVLYRLTLCEPLLATSLQGDPNSSVSLPYVAGGLVRGALIQHYIRTKNPADLLQDAQAQRLFINGDTRYLHAYPLAKESDPRTLPTPRSLLRRKHNEISKDAPIIDILDASHPECNSETRSMFERSNESNEPDTLKPLGVPFCGVSGDTFYTYRPDRTIAVHILRNPVKGRSIRNVLLPNDAQVGLDGAIFRYDALAPEQQFQGVVLADSDDAITIETMLKELGTCWLGRSRSAQYGKTSISNVEVVDEWRECGSDEVTELTENDEMLYSITFLSDAILRNQQGQPVTKLDAITLAAYLGFPEDKLNAVTIDDEHSFSTAIEVGGFNRHWKLPLAQEYAISAGSVISFRLSQSLSAKQVATLEQCGIGTRCIEGFGRIAFNWRGTMERSAKKGNIAHTAPSKKADGLKPHEQTLAKRMARQLYERDVTRSIVEFVKNHSVSQIPSNSQFGRLRVLVRQALPIGDVAYVRERYAAFKPTAKRQYENARLGNDSFDTWITKLLNDPDQVWTQFHDFKPKAIAGHNAERDAQQVTLQLLAAVLAAPTRDQWAKEAQQ